jgi:ATP-dependent DNA ligase
MLRCRSCGPAWSTATRSGATRPAWRSSTSCAGAPTAGPSSCWPFDLLELDGADLRRVPIDDRPGEIVFAHACKLGLEGIVSKRRGSRYQSGKSAHWVKSKNPNHAAVTRLLEEDWNG